MTGLEKIQEKILAESKEAAEKIVADANAEAKAILIAARKKAQEISAEIIKNAESVSDKKNRIAKNEAESITRNRYLEVRNAIINDIISAAYEEIEKLSDEDYFNLLKILCFNNIVSGEYIMRLNSVDLERLPDGFEDDINSKIYKTGTVYIKKEPINIENGFILIGDGVEINCTFRAVFDDKMDSLKDMLNKALFN